MKTKIEINIDTNKISRKKLLDLVCAGLEMVGLEPDKEFKVILRK